MTLEKTHTDNCFHYSNHGIDDCHEARCDGREEALELFAHCQMSVLWRGGKGRLTQETTAPIFADVHGLV